MKRRNFINKIIYSSGGFALLPSIYFFNSCSHSPELRTELSQNDIPLLDEIGEIIIPSTNGIPGAKEAKIGAYMVLMVQDCYDQEKQEIFLNGLNDLEIRCSNQYKSSFVNLTSTEKMDVLKQINAESIAHKNTNLTSSHYFELLKSLTISGYFSSEIGMTKARNYLPIPGKYESCIPYNQGDRPWA